MADDDDDRREGRFPDDSSPLGPLAMGPVSAQTPIQANGTFPRAAALRQILPFDGGREGPPRVSMRFREASSPSAFGCAVSVNNFRCWRLIGSAAAGKTAQVTGNRPKITA